MKFCKNALNGLNAYHIFLLDTVTQFITLGEIPTSILIEIKEKKKQPAIDTIHYLMLLYQKNNTQSKKSHRNNLIINIILLTPVQCLQLSVHINQPGMLLSKPNYVHNVQFTTKNLVVKYTELPTTKLIS
ncbi:hypothetical protein KSF78_0009297 [Schistosoma japonicum]|nr:hypothetical protein KSF78_0009297 [Schistosoma japonicum]